MSDKPIIGIVGFGLEGEVTYQYFKDKAKLYIFDEREIEVPDPNITFTRSLTIPAFIPIVYKTPGIPTHKLVLKSENTRITTLMELVLERVRDRAIGVTGTKGKSTVAALIQHILVGAGRDAVLFGNIGVADMHILDTDSPDRLYVIELSSYQCEHLSHSPHVAILTNFYPEHLSHHGSLDTYREAKLNLARFQGEEDFFINGSDLKVSFKGKTIRPPVSAPFETTLLGEHNQKNCATALAAVHLLGISEEEARAHIATFSPLPYRLEKVGEYNGIILYDDSLATVPQATTASIHALPRVDTIILGGEDRGISFTKFADELANTKIQTFIVFPDTGSRMVEKVKDRTVIPVSSMEEAVRAAFAHTPKGGTVLLSNASPSFNLFKNYKDKSTQYRKLIQSLSMGMHIEIFLSFEEVKEHTVVIPKLSHGSNIMVVRSGKEDLSNCDALITENPDLSLGIKTADCAPVCFSDGKKIGIAHIGWRGLCLGLIEKMLTHFDATTLSVYVGPFLHSFEIQKDFCYDQITQKFGEQYIEQKGDTFVFHFKDVIDSFLPRQTVYDPRDTETDFSFPSYRRDKTKDRFVTIVSFEI